jgi:hypothetical protein
MAGRQTNLASTIAQILEHEQTCYSPHDAQCLCKIAIGSQARPQRQPPFGVGVDAVVSVLNSSECCFPAV